MNILNLMKCDDYKKIRLGKDNDGGYVIYDGLNYDLIIGCGVSNDLSFEEDFVNKYNCKSIVYDGTIKKLPKHSFNHIWKNENVYQGTLNELLNNNKNIFLKMDIEGCEWDFFKNVNLENISQMVIEFHDNRNFTIDYDVLKKIEETHYLIHIHGNNFRKRQLKIEDKLIHSIFEVSYINKKLCDKVKKVNYSYDGNLDMPNNKKVEDIKNMRL
jgi:hypothetical protein